MIEIRPFVQDDAPGVRALVLPIQREEFQIPVTLEGQPDLLDISGFFQHGAGNFWVATDEGRVVGTIGLLDIGRGQAALRKMFVAPSHRGREAGVASGLLSSLVAWAEDMKIVEVFLGTTEKFLAAHRFYERNGFELVHKEALPTAFPAMAVDTRFYRRRLGQDTTGTASMVALSEAASVRR